MIFLDVGAHDGQTLEEVLKPGYPFTKVYAFEPMPTQYANLIRLHDDPRLVTVNAGLSNRTGIRPVYGTNTAMEASVFAEKNDVDAAVATECRFIRASDFFHDRIPQAAVVKLNCEGSECDILTDLAISGEIHKITNVMIDFDVRKIPGQKHREKEVLKLLGDIGFDRYFLSEQVMIGRTHQLRIAHWLSGVL